jgi:hypothetical protein
MTRVRDPLSVRYDAVTHALLDRAARASRTNRSVLAWVASPRAEFRDRDQSGRTRHERAFIRSAYYQVRGWHILRSETVEWSLQLKWGNDTDCEPSRPGYLARPVFVRLRPRDEARITGESYIAERMAGRSGGREQAP